MPTYNGILLSQKRNEVLIHATTWMNLEHTLREISQTQKDKMLSDSICMKYLDWTNSQRHKVEQTLLAAEERKELLFNNDRASVWDDEKVLEMDSGDGHTTLEMHLMSLNCSVKWLELYMLLK